MFDISKGSRIVLYGYSQFDLVKDRYDVMRKLGYLMIGYIDQTAKRLEMPSHIPCWTLDSFPYQRKEREQIVTILLLQNGRTHEQIAKTLHDSGFDKLLFVPEQTNTFCKKRLFQKYNAFIQQEYEELTDIPEWKDLCKPEPYTVPEFLRCSKHHCTVQVPAELVFTYTLENNEEENICFDKSYQELFSVLEGRSFSCNRYFEFMGADTDSQKKALLADRFSLYCQWENQRQYNLDCFTDAAAIAVWNSRGYFNLIDGHHRAAYLLRKGYRKIPLAMSREDYNKWNSCIEEAAYERLRAAHVPVPHPAFMQEKCIFQPHWWSVICYLYRVGHGRLCRLVEIDDYMGYYAAAFQRIVKQTAVVIYDSAPDPLLCRSMQKCMHQNITIVETSGLELQKQDIIYIKLSLENASDRMEYIQNACGQYIILDLPEQESEAILERALKFFSGSLWNIGNYYNETLHVICAIERNITEWQK